MDESIDVVEWDFTDRCVSVAVGDIGVVTGSTIAVASVAVFVAAGRSIAAHLLGPPWTELAWASGIGRGDDGGTDDGGRVGAFYLVDCGLERVDLGVEISEGGFVVDEGVGEEAEQGVFYDSAEVQCVTVCCFYNLSHFLDVVL